MYDTLLNVLVKWLGVAVDTMPYSVCEVLATLACVFVFLIPFLIVWKVLCLICGR